MNISKRESLSRLSAPLEATGLILLRFIIYTVVIFSFTLLLPLVMPPGDTHFFTEGGPVEWAQLLLLFLSAVICLTGCLANRPFNLLFQCLLCLCAFAITRELDAFLHDLLPKVGWKIAYIFAVYAIYVVLKNWNNLKLQIIEFINCRAFAILWTGLMVAVPFAQLVGNGRFLKIAMGSHYISGYKRVVEESGELVGYFIILAGCVEALIQTRLINLVVDKMWSENTTALSFDEISAPGP